MPDEQTTGGATLPEWLLSAKELPGRCRVHTAIGQAADGPDAEASGPENTGVGTPRCQRDADTHRSCAAHPGTAGPEPHTVVRWRLCRGAVRAGPW
ncbi:hypothetical protein ACIQPP_07920 [Streptomyces violaceusniger]|uniref:hypothetical protein n=1 Tax=Streptomyces violaceusniger TaxID=68280 RepID=UPI00131B59BE|nr:hypothetical protein [Streptomyces hygroscopicus]